MDGNVESELNAEEGLAATDIVSLTEIDEENTELGTSRGEGVSCTETDSSISDDGEIANVVETREPGGCTGVLLIVSPISDVSNGVTTSVDLVGNIGKLITDVTGMIVELPANGVVAIVKGVVAMLKDMVATVKGVVSVADVDIYKVLNSGVDVDNKTDVATACGVVMGYKLDDNLGKTNDGVTAIEELDKAVNVERNAALDGTTVLCESNNTLDD